MIMWVELLAERAPDAGIVQVHGSHPGFDILRLVLGDVCTIYSHRTRHTKALSL